MKRIISLLLALVLVLGVTSTAVFAKTAEKARPTYVALGDSIPAGRGNFPQSTYRGFTRVEGTYPALVADGTNHELNSLAYCGFRLEEIRWMLEDDFKGDNFLFNIPIQRLEEPERYKMRPVFRDEIRDADFITIDVGSNDIMTYALLRLLESLTRVGIHVDAEDQFHLTEGDKVWDLSPLETLLQNDALLSKYPDLLGNIIDGLYDGFENFKENWDATLADIYALNPDVTVIAVGKYNHLDQVKLTDHDIIKLSSALDGVYALINHYLKSGSKYSDRTIFADVTGTPLPENPPIIGSDISALFKEITTNVHPSLEGHAYMAKKILEVVPESVYEAGRI